MDYLLNYTNNLIYRQNIREVLNLIINGLPSKHKKKEVKKLKQDQLVLNLIINGLPSKLVKDEKETMCLLSFKPYYKWITF